MRPFRTIPTTDPNGPNGPTDPHGPDGLEDHDRGLAFDLTTMSRRRGLTLLGSAGLAALAAACTPGDESSSATTTTTSAAGGATTTTSGSGATSTTAAGATTTTGAATCSVIPEETGGPYPGDGSNGPDVLSASGVVRRDIRSSFGSSTTVAPGVPLEIELTVLDTGTGCAPLEGAAVYLWHCDAVGRYSMYSQGVTGENFLRGVQAADGSGVVRFTSIFPGAYSGRWPHIHFEVYPSVAKATSASGKLRTSQLALPEDVCKLVYATSGYGSSASNLAGSSLSSDNVFRDGWSLQMAALSGSVADGYTAKLTVPV